MYSTFRTTGFKKDYKKLSKSDQLKLKDVIVKLANGEELEEKFRDHKLVGNYIGGRECYIKPDLLLIYRIKNDIFELALIRVDSHSELFRK